MSTIPSNPKVHNHGLENRYSGLLVSSGHGLGEVRGLGDIVLDSVRGSGTAAACSPFRRTASTAKPARPTAPSPPSISSTSPTTPDLSTSPAPGTTGTTTSSRATFSRSSRPCPTGLSPWSMPTRPTAPSASTAARPAGSITGGHGTTRPGSDSRRSRTCCQIRQPPDPNGPPRP